MINHEVFSFGSLTQKKVKITKKQPRESIIYRLLESKSAKEKSFEDLQGLQTYDRSHTLDNENDWRRSYIKG